MNLRNLVLILMFGGLFYGMYYLYHAQASQPLQADLIAVNPLQISRLRITGPEREQYIELQRQDSGWIASNGQVHLIALSAPVEAVLQNLHKITTTDIAATSESDWNNYGLGDGYAVRVELFSGKERIEDFWVGQVPPGELPEDSLVYLRIQGEQEVYVVKGLQTAPFYQPFSAYRPKTILSIPVDSRIDSFSFIYPDTTYTLNRRPQGWILNRLAMAEPAEVDHFLGNLQDLSSSDFADDFDHNRAGVERLLSLQLYPSPAETPILVDMYLDTLREHPYVLRSTQNPGTWFECDSLELYKRFVLPLDSLQLQNVKL
ncbi:MAG: DUF4340 domain-containing protein [Saprospiraceae bacterium]|nr:DUF4340 domain-containing protein [Lewinella sp.]